MSKKGRGPALTKEDGRTIMLLSDAARDLKDLFAALNDEPSEAGGWDYRAVELMCGEYCSSGANGITSVVVDLDTGRRILDAARIIIAERCRELNIATDDLEPDE